jgi:hypothetical protein
MGRSLLGLALLLSLAAPARAFETAVNYQRSGTQLLSFSSNCGISVASSAAGNPINFSPSGLGHTGGTSDIDIDIDSGESFLFASTLGARPGAGYRVAAASNLDADAEFGETFVEGFVGAVSLGVEATSGIGEIDVASLFGGAALSSFRVTALESIRISRAQWRLPPAVTVNATVASNAFGPAFSFFSPLLQCGLRLETADGSFHVAAGGGLGIVGGASDRIDAGESVLVEFGEPIPQVEYQLTDSTNVGGTAAEGDHFIEAFGVNGISLGLRAASDGAGYVDLTALYGGAAIEAFELLGVNDSFRLDNLRFVPEPVSGLAPAAFAALAAIAQRRRVQATPSTSR